MPIHKGMLETWNMYMSEEKKRREKDAVQKIYRRGMRWGGLCNTQGETWFRAVFTLLCIVWTHACINYGFHITI